MNNHSYKRFYNFVKIFNPEICDLYDDIENRPQPKPGDKFIYDNLIIVFDKIIFDSSYENGVAHIYRFHDMNNNIIDIRSINDIYDYSIITDSEKYDYLAFWKYCTPCT